MGDGDVVRSDRELRARLRSSLRAGRYTATMRVLNTDGHVTTGTWSVRLR